MNMKGITYRLIFYILTSSSIIFALIFGYNYLVSRAIITKNIRKNAEDLAVLTVSRIETVLRSVEQVPKNLAYFLEESDCDKQAITNMLRSVVENNDGIYGSTIAFEPYVLGEDTVYFAPYFHESDDGPEYTDLGSDVYRYLEWDWYKIPKKLGAPVWSEPYYDEGGGNVIMSTYSVPFYKDEENGKKFMGIVTADIRLSWLRDMLSSIKIGETGYVFLISQNGTIVTHPLEEFIMNETIFSLAKRRDDPGLDGIGKKMIEGDSGFVPVTSIVTGKKCWMVYVPVPSAGWSLAALFPQDELMEDITHLNGVVLGLGLLGFLFLLIVIVLISGSITRPLRILAKTTEDIAEGNLDFDPPKVRSDDEVGHLAESFVYMRDSLKKHIKELTQATAARERMESELKVARDIQMSILPKVFPAFPDKHEFDIHATLESAKEVGGDLYDFFLIDEEHLCFVIGDVSGKGVPAALFMAMTKTLVKMTAKEEKDPGVVMTKVNRELCRENDACMFVTLFCAILNIHTGEVNYVNGGHNPCLILRSGKEAEFLESPGSTVVGVFESSVYKTEKLVLGKGDVIFMYTDGVTEAFNKEHEQFSEERLRKTLTLCRGRSAAVLTGRIMEEVRSFTQGAEQSDDITVMVLRYGPEIPNGGGSPREERTIILKNDLMELHKLADSVDEFSEKNSISAEAARDINLALEEAFVNVISYAYSDKSEHSVVLKIALTGGCVSMEIMDDGAEFNPLAIPVPDIERPLEERPNDGLGVFLIRKLMDEVEYRRECGRNILTLRKNIKLGS